MNVKNKKTENKVLKPSTSQPLSSNSLGL